jgi:C4-dicarboxylate-binding protein DctP
MPVRSLATQVPELQVLELSFFYADLDAVHRVLDGPLGESLRQAARENGWEILAFWDEGMHVMSGLRRYDRAINLTGMEFIFTRSDPVAETQLGSWNAFPRRIQPEDNETVMRECMVASRATTLQELWREQLQRVHLAITLTNHRYEGWVLAAPTSRWREIPANDRERLQELVAGATHGQRRDARQREMDTLSLLRKEGVIVHDVDEAERKAFQKALPPWTELLSADLDPVTRKRLVSLAATGPAAGTTAVTGAGTKPGSHTTHGTPASEAD